MFHYIIQKVLSGFSTVELSATEQKTAHTSIHQKYIHVLRKTLFYLIISTPTIIFLNTSVLVAVLIPLTMVAGTAWFSVSLAGMKEKFSDFGLELTINLLEAFSISLALLLAISTFSIAKPILGDIFTQIPHLKEVQFASVILGTITIWNIIYKIFIGAVKYDLNDAMLTGQNETAEKFFKKSLSFLNSAATELKEGKDLEVANYYIGLAFSDVFSQINSLNPRKNVQKQLAEANKLIKRPNIPQKQADKLAVQFIKQFEALCTNPNNNSKNLLHVLNDEVNCIENNNELQKLVDSRLWHILQIIEQLLINQGESLFNKELS